MRAMRLRKPAPIENHPLELVELPIPEPGPGQLLLKVRACGVCHTDLHIVQGEIHPPRLPVTPGHQVIAQVEALGAGVEGWQIGERAGVPWLHSADGSCEFCKRGEENLCPQAQFTGFDLDGGFAEFMLSQAEYTLHLPQSRSDLELAPLLCAGIIGYRSLRRADLGHGERLGLVGFGASAHLAIQVARHWNCEVYVFTRSESHRKLALDLGAAWAGGVEDDAPATLDRAVIFAPAGPLVPVMLAKLRAGGTLAINAIHMSPIPEMPYERIYGERTLRSVANATYRDGVEFLQLATEISVEAETTVYPLTDANRALADVAASAIDGAGVLLP
jgi:propanol-preferring alcohol dehydrogenase